MKPTALIASAIRREREQAGLSLSALATKANLAKSTLSQLEAGKGNPSIETLWTIASALDIPFSFLFEGETSHNQLIRADEGVPLISDSSELSALLLSKCPPGRRRDLYRVALARGSPRRSKPHPRGTIEHAFISSGIVRLGPEEATVEIGPSDYFCYPADVPHSYEALSENAVMLLAIEAPIFV
jgi:transcriptional regulator with XRE-family HTH domain